MRIDSCRTCGIAMKEFQTCPVCRVVSRFVCPKCGKTSDEQIHPECSLLNKSVIAN